MKTIFKEGQEVYDNSFRRGKKGKVRFISKNKFRSYILMDFENASSALYTLNGNLINFNGEIIRATPTLSVFETKYISEEDFNKIPTVEDALKWLELKGDFYINGLDYNEELYTSEEMYKAFEALKYLIILREYYNEGWQPDWRDKDEKRFFIEVWDIGFFEEDSYRRQRPLIFKTRNIAKKFIEEQKELLKIAKPLL